MNDGLDQSSPSSGRRPMTPTPVDRGDMGRAPLDVATILDSLSQHVAVLDSGGTIVAVNRAWDEFAHQNGASAQGVGCFVGTSYLDMCREDGQNPDDDGAAVAKGIRGVLAGTLPNFTREYPCTSPSEARWFRLTVTPLLRGDGVVCAHEDITDLWLAREHARQTAQSLTVIGDHVPGMLGYWDRDLRCRFANQSYLEWFGRTKEGMLGLRIQDLQGEELFRKNEPFLRAALRGEAQDFERQITKANGDIGHLWARYVPDVVDGEVRGLYAIVLDVTDRVRAEGAGRFARAITENMAEGVQLTRFADQIIVYTNPTFERMFGYEPGDLVGKPVSILNAHGDRTPQEVADEIIRSLHEQGSWRGELLNQRRDGSHFWSSAHVSAFHHPEHGAVWLTVQEDITARKEKEDALRLTEQRYRSVVLGLEEGIVVHDRDGGILTANAAAERILGLPPDQIAGRSSVDPFWRTVREDGSPFPGGEHPAMRALATGEPQSGVIMGIDRPSGDRVWISINAHPMFEAGDPRPYAATVSFSDITESRRVNEVLRSSLREKESLLKEVHHRVKNNLQVINSLLRLESRRAREASTRDVLGEMQNRIRSMALLHESLYRTGNFAAVDLADYLGRLAAELVRVQGAGAATVHLVRHLVPCPVPIEQSIPCALIVNELVTNSLKHAFRNRPAGEVRLTIESIDDGRIRIAVGDDGVGLPGDFDLGRTDSLGLQLVSDLARQLGGYFRVVSGLPTTFEVVFRILTTDAQTSTV